MIKKKKKRVAQSDKGTASLQCASPPNRNEAVQASQYESMGRHDKCRAKHAAGAATATQMREEAPGSSERSGRG